MKQLLLLLFSSITSLCFAQDFPRSFGFSNLSGGNGVTVSDAFSVFNNPASMEGDSLLLGISAQNLFLIEDLHRFTASSQIPISFGNVGVGVYRFGDELFHETALNLGIQKMVNDQLSVGVSLYGVQYYAEFAENRSTLFPQLGLHYQYSDHLHFGLSVSNPFSQDVNAPFDQSLQSRSTIGMVYHAESSFSTSLQVNLTEYEGLSTGLALEYEIFDFLSFTLGGNTNPGVITTGLILTRNNMKAGIGGGLQNPLGFSPEASFQSGL